VHLVPIGLAEKHNGKSNYAPNRSGNRDTVRSPQSAGLVGKQGLSRVTPRVSKDTGRYRTMRIPEVGTATPFER